MKECYVYAVLTKGSWTTDEKTIISMECKGSNRRPPFRLLQDEGVELKRDRKMAPPGGGGGVGGGGGGGWGGGLGKREED